MNYMHMVKFKSLSLRDALAVLCFQEREEIFKNELNCSNIVPYYVILEALFQTAGRIAREYSENTYGGIIVSFSDFDFTRPVFFNEELTIKAWIKSYNSRLRIFYFSVTLLIGNKTVLPEGHIMIMQTNQIKSNYLNNNILKSVNENLDQIGY